MSPCGSSLGRRLPVLTSGLPVLLFSFLLLLVLSGCVVIPIPTGDKVVMSGTRVGADAIARIQVGVTTRDQVLESIGAPILDWEDERILAYQWDVRKMLVIWIAGGGYSAAAGAFDVPRHHVLLIQFDPDGKVRRVGRTVRGGMEHIGDHLVEWWNEEGVKAGEKLLPPDSARLPRVRVIFRVVGRVDGRSIEEASGGKVHGGRSIFGAATLDPAWGSLHSGGSPVLGRPRSLPGAAGKDGWFETSLRAENSYLYLGSYMEVRSVWPRSARNYNLVYRLELSPDFPVVYAGSLYLDCLFQRKFQTMSLPHLGGILGETSEVKDEPQELRAALVAAGIAPDSVSTRLMRSHVGIPVLRTPAGSRITVPGK